MIKRALGLWIFILSLFVLNPLVFADTGFHIKLNGGLGSLRDGKDFQGLFDSTGKRWTIQGYQGNFDLTFPRSLAEANLQAVFQLTANFGIGLGPGYLEKSWEQNPDVSYNLGTPGRLQGKNTFKIQSIPFTIEAILFVTTGRFTFNLYSGAGYYWNRLQLHLTTDTGEPSHPGKPDWKSHLVQSFISGWNGGPGFHGGIGVEVALSPHFALTVDGIYRRAQFDGFQGNYDLEETQNWNGGHSESTYHSDRAQAWYKGIKNDGDTWYYLEISETEPSSFFCLSSFRVDLTGIYLRIGIKISL